MQRVFEIPRNWTALNHERLMTQCASITTSNHWWPWMNESISCFLHHYLVLFLPKINFQCFEWLGSVYIHASDLGFHFIWCSPVPTFHHLPLFPFSFLSSSASHFLMFFICFFLSYINSIWDILHCWPNLVQDFDMLGNWSGANRLAVIELLI